MYGQEYIIAHLPAWVVPIQIGLCFTASRLLEGGTQHIDGDGKYRSVLTAGWR